MMTKACVQRTLVGYQITGDHDIEARYREAALRVDGVSSVATRRTPRGYGSADVVVLFRGLLPTQAELQLVEAALNDAGLVGEDTWVRAPKHHHGIRERDVHGHGQRGGRGGCHHGMVAKHKSE